MTPRQSPLVSIVVNNYNYSAYLEQAIDSALSQDYSSFEVIVVDDGSTDDSRDVISRFGARIITVLKENGGQASAFNAGFNVARGSHILFLDADDVLLPGAVGSAIAVMDETIAKVHWPLEEIDTFGNNTGVVHPDRPLAAGDLRSKTLVEGPLSGISPPTSGNLWSRRFLEQVLPVPEESFRINADGYLITLAFAYGEVRALTEPQGFYRVHGANHFASLSPHERRAMHMEKFRLQCDELAEHLGRMGLEPKPLEWITKKGIYDPAVDALAKDQLSALMPRRAKLILVDEDTWGDWSSASEIAGACVIPFLERDGRYWGRPEDDAQAITGLERLKSSGAEFIAFPWFTTWWLDAYPVFARHLRETSDCIVSNNYLAVFSLRPYQGATPEQSSARN